MVKCVRRGFFGYGSIKEEFEVDNGTVMIDLDVMEHEIKERDCDYQTVMLFLLLKRVMKNKLIDLNSLKSCVILIEGLEWNWYEGKWVFIVKKKDLKVYSVNPGYWTIDNQKIWVVYDDEAGDRLKSCAYDVARVDNTVGWNRGFVL